MADNSFIQSLRDNLFAEPDTRQAFAIVDGAIIDGLPDKLQQWQPEYVCLFAGELEPDMAQVAPYLVKLEEQSEFTDWLFSSCWDRPWGIFALVPHQTHFRQVRTHFRKFLMVHTEEQQSLYFRFYDPCVLEVFMPTCDAQQLAIMFGPVEMYVIPSQKGTAVNGFQFRDGRLHKHAVSNTSQPSGAR